MILLSLKLFRVSLLAASGSCAVGICGGESPPYLASPCSSPSHTPQPQACHILALQPSIAPSSFGNNNNFFFLNLAFYGPRCLIAAYLQASSPTTLLLTPYRLVQLNSFPVTPCALQPLCSCSACACCRVCPLPLSLWKYDSFFTASGESHPFLKFLSYPGSDVVLSTCFTHCISSCELQLR